MVALRILRAEIVDLGEVEGLIKLYDGMLRGLKIGKGGWINAVVVNNDYLIVPIRCAGFDAFYATFQQVNSIPRRYDDAHQRCSSDGMSDAVATADTVCDGSRQTSSR